jgi:hypothetical protein
MFEFISKKISDIKILHEGYTADYFLNRMKPNALFPILFIQNIFFSSFFKSGTDIFYQIIAHVHFREILSGYFLFSRFDGSIFVTQLLDKHMFIVITIFPERILTILGGKKNISSITKIAKFLFELVHFYK